MSPPRLAKFAQTDPETNAVAKAVVHAAMAVLQEHEQKAAEKEKEQLAVPEQVIPFQLLPETRLIFPEHRLILRSTRLTIR